MQFEQKAIAAQELNVSQHFLTNPPGFIQLAIEPSTCVDAAIMLVTKHSIAIVRHLLLTSIISPLEVG